MSRLIDMLYASLMAPDGRCFRKLSAHARDPVSTHRFTGSSKTKPLNGVKTNKQTNNSRSTNIKTKPIKIYR